MKKIISIIISLVAAFSVFAGCAGKVTTAATPKDEFDRLNAMGAFGTMFSFESFRIRIEQNVTLSSDVIKWNNGGKETEETMVFLLDKTKSTDVRTYAEAKRLYNIDMTVKDTPGSNVVEYAPPIKWWFQDNKDNESGSYYSFSDYESKRTEVPYHWYRKSQKLFEYEKLSDVSGAKAGSSYMITASVPEENYKDFFLYTYAFAPFLEYLEPKSQDDDPDESQDDKFRYMDIDEIYSASFAMRSTALGPEEIILRVELKGKIAEAASTDDEKRITFTVKTSYSYSGFNINVA
jgi:hypothetical protein